jgi:hypothetical protein
MPSISINLTRDDNKTNDDVITIKRNAGYNEFEIHYTDPNEGTVIKHKMTNLYREKVLEYIYLLLKNLYLDEQKFRSVQINMPGMPRVLVSCTEFSDLYYREHFEELIGFGLDTLGDVKDICNRPVYETPCRAPYAACRATATCDAECDTDYDAELDREVINRELQRGQKNRRGKHLFFD